MLKKVALTAALTTALTLTPAAATATATDSPIYRLALGVGATASDATFSWRTHHRGAEVVEIWETTNPESRRRIEAREQDNGALLYVSQEANVGELEASTSYTYRVGSEAGGWSQEQTFTTGDGDDTWDFLALADAQIGVNLDNTTQGKNWRNAVAAATAARPEAEMLLSLGDQVDGWGAIQPQYDQFFSAPQLRILPTAAIPGNHETYVSGMKHFSEHFSLPNEQRGTGNYFYERNNVLFISLNSNESDPTDIASHKEFIRATVAKHGADKDWIVATYHHGPFAQGSHTADADVEALRRELTPVLSEAGVDVVLSGHDHIYSRSHLMRGTEPVVPNKRAERGDRLRPQDGEVLYITATTAGAGKFYDFHDRLGTKHPNARRELIDQDLEQPWTAYWNQDYTPDYTAVSVSPTELTLTTYNVNTPYVVDKVTLEK